jgi:hypothetical protein
LEDLDFKILILSTLAVDGWFAAQPKDFFLGGIKKSEEQSH